MVIDFMSHRVSRSVCCTLRWEVINIPNTVQSVWCRIQPMIDFSKIARKNILASPWNCSQSSLNGSSWDVCLCEGVLTMKGTLHPARGSVQCPAPACGHHCLLSISEAVTCRRVSHEPWCGGGWECYVIPPLLSQLLTTYTSLKTAE